MAFKLKGMHFGENTSSAMKQGEEKSPATEENEKEELEEKSSRMDLFNKIAGAGDVNWEQTDIDLTSDTKRVIDTNKEKNPDPSSGHTPQTVKPIDDVTPQTVEPPKEITPQTVKDSKVDSNENSKTKEESPMTKKKRGFKMNSPLKNYKKGYYGIK